VFVIVIHRVHDRDGFRAAEAAALAAGGQEGVVLAVRAASRDHRVGIFLWEGESVTAVRDVVEGAVGPFSDNEYYEIDADSLVPRPNRGPGGVVDATHHLKPKRSTPKGTLS
jgi:hypothetical protein